jgi:hypothetical protein
MRFVPKQLDADTQKAIAAFDGKVKVEKPGVAKAPAKSKAARFTQADLYKQAQRILQKQ